MHLLDLSTFGSARLVALLFSPQKALRPRQRIQSIALQWRASLVCRRVLFNSSNGMRQFNLAPSVVVALVHLDPTSSLTFSPSSTRTRNFGARTRRLMRNLDPATKLPALTLNRQERGAALESAASSSDEPATNSIQALVGRRLVLPCSNLTADQLSRSSSSSPSTTTTTTSNQSNARRQPQQQPHQAGPSQQRSRQPASAAAANGIVSLIVWHKDDPQLSSPIFTIDARGSAGNLREARQQTYADWLKGRAHFEESAAAAGFSSASSAGQTPALVIDEALQVDAGLYTCTVEFNKAPTQTYQIRVNLIGK